MQVSNNISSKRAVGDREETKKGGWDQDASRGTGLLSCHPHSWVPSLALCFGIYCPKSKSSSQSSSCGDLQPGQSGRSLPQQRSRASPHQAGLEQLLTRLWAPGMGWDLSWEDSPLGIQCCPAKGYMLGGHHCGFSFSVNQTSRSSPGCSPWVRYSTLSSRSVQAAVS